VNLSNCSFARHGFFAILLSACSDDTLTPDPTLHSTIVDGQKMDSGSEQDITPDVDVPDASEVQEVDQSVDTTSDVFVCKDNASCDTKNPCTQDWCNLGTGECQYTPLPDKVCTDGDACTVNDICTSSGQCIGAKQVVCNDNSPCTKDSCKQLSGCDYEAVDAICSDGDVCTKNDSCVAGLCLGTKFVCDDGLDCTEDSCDKNLGCSTVKLNNLPCNDNSACTINDLCDKGFCKGASINCSDANPCTQDVCDKVSGCFSAPTSNGSKCTDGNACTINDNCKDSVCISGSQKNCDDSSVCTNDSCDAATGECLHIAVVGVHYCVDNNACTYDDTCKLGVCTGKILQCYDGLDCTQDSCDKGTGCSFMIQDKAPCNDGNACTIGDTCAKDKCFGNVKTCEDNNDCTIDTCDPAVGTCNFTANDGYYCSDVNACTSGDVCKGTKCVGVTIICNDGNPCTSDSCNQKTGCVFLPTPNAPCDDANLCSTDDICQQTVCKSKPVVCDDGNTCSTDTCNKSTGKCEFKIFNDSYSCNDGDLCTTADVCLFGECKGSINMCNDNNPCTIDACNPKDGKCANTKVPNCI
jgi:hypothetical protein